MKPIVHVRRRMFIGKPLDGTWAIQCDACGSSDFLGSLLQPVMIAHERADAIWWGNWHAREHAIAQCRTCHHNPALPRPEVVDANLVRVPESNGYPERLYVRSIGGWSLARAEQEAT